MALSSNINVKSTAYILLQCKELDDQNRLVGTKKTILQEYNNDNSRLNYLPVFFWINLIFIQNY